MSLWLAFQRFLSLPELKNVCHLDSSIDALMNKLKHNVNLAIKWTDCNCSKLHQDKCHVIILRHEFQYIWIKIENIKIWENKKEEIILGVLVEYELKFGEFVLSLYLKVVIKFVLAKLANFLNFSQFSKKLCRVMLLVL